MASSPASFKLDRNIFNDTLYSRMRDFWFAHLPDGASEANEESNKRWYGGLNAEGKAAFDGECTANFGHALEAVAPANFTLPPFQSYEADIETADHISKPFLDDVKDAQAQDEKKGADTLLSLLLLFDQMPRNIYRDQAGLRLVYGHYDRIAFALLRASLLLRPNPVDAECYRLRPAISQWYTLPLMHSEHLPSHELYVEIGTKAKKHAEDSDAQPAVNQLKRSLSFESKHLEPLKRFGRYPHRNAALGRASTPEEEEFMRTGETFGVKQGGEGKDEL